MSSPVHPAPSPVSGRVSGHLVGPAAEEALVVRLTDPDLEVRLQAVSALSQSTDTWQDHWIEPVVRWWTRETDLEPVLTDADVVLDAVSLGAQLLRRLVLDGSAPAARVLGACSRRLVAPTEFPWSDDMESSVALTVVCALNQCGDSSEATAWLGAVRRLVSTPQPWPPEACVGNTLRTLRCIHHLLVRGVPVAGNTQTPRFSDDVLASIDACLVSAQPWLWA